MRDSSEFHRDLSTGRGIFDSREGFSSLSLSRLGYCYSFHWLGWRIRGAVNGGEILNVRGTLGLLRGVVKVGWDILGPFCRSLTYFKSHYISRFVSYVFVFDYFFRQIFS